MAKIRYNRIIKMWEVTFNGHYWKYKDRANAELRVALCK